MTETGTEVRDDPATNKGEADFALDEVFFTRTDERGAILAGNEVFRRVSEYSWDELLGAPHKIVRHQDVPRGLFRLIWDALHRNETIGGYVKNRSKSGRYYWVFALMIPCAGGFLSVRIKPSSALLPNVENMYLRLVEREKKEIEDPRQSADLLLEDLRAMGFSEYGRFMSHALGEELTCRNATLGRPVDETVARFREMQKAADGLTAETDGLVQEFETTEIIPHNMRVIASRLEPNGGPISTLSTNYGGMSREMSSWFETHVVGENSNFSTIKATVASSMFLQCMARILSECAGALAGETSDAAGPAWEEERQILLDLAAETSARADAGQNKVAEETYRILDACKKMNRHMLGLSTTRVMCKIEGARLSEGRESLTDIIGELNGFQQRIGNKLARIEELSGSIRTLLT